MVRRSARSTAPKGAGAVLAFEIKGGVEAGQAFVDALELHSHVANIGDVRSLVIHPASTTHTQLTPEEQLATGVTPGLVRLAVGIENIDDILADLEPGFAAAKRFCASDAPIRTPRRRSDDPVDRNVDVPTPQRCPPKGEVGVVDIGPLKLGRRGHRDVTVAVQTWGELSPNRDNAVLVLHALTGDSHVTGPTGPGTRRRLVGRRGRTRRADRHRPLVCDRPNVLGGCRGTTGPASPAPDGRPWGSRFPPSHVRDQVGPTWPRWPTARHRPGRRGGRRVDGRHAGAGVDRRPPRPGRARPWCSRSAPARPPTRSAPRAPRSRRSRPTRTGRTATTTAPAASPDVGMGIARRIAHLTYRGETELDDRFANDPQGDEDPLTGGRYAVQSYLEYQGDKLWPASTRAPTWC